MLVTVVVVVAELELLAYLHANGAAVAAGPVTPLMQYAAVQLARRYGIPVLADGGSSDSKLRRLSR